MSIKSIFLKEFSIAFTGYALFKSETATNSAYELKIPESIANFWQQMPIAVLCPQVAHSVRRALSVSLIVGAGSA